MYEHYGSTLFCPRHWFQIDRHLVLSYFSRLFKNFYLKGQSMENVFTCLVGAKELNYNSQGL